MESNETMDPMNGTMAGGTGQGAAMDATEMERKMKECLDACLACISACNHCLDACLEEEHAAMMKACIRLDRDCADLCGMAIQMMTRNSPFVKEFMLLCAQACDLCAEECAKHDHDHCQACAEACRACSRACMAMAV